MKPSALIIEDDADTARLLRILLDRHGWESEHTALLEPGIRRANEHPFPEVILLDLQLPDSAAWETVVRLPELMRNGPVVVLSNYQDPNMEERIRASGSYFCAKRIDEMGERVIFGAVVEAIQAWRNRPSTTKKSTSRIDLNLLEMQAIQSKHAHG